MATIQLYFIENGAPISCRGQTFAGNTLGFTKNSQQEIYYTDTFNQVFVNYLPYAQ